MARAYADVGMRAVLAPMVADLSFFEAIPGLMDRLPPALQKEVESFTLRAVKATHAADEEGAAEAGRSTDACTSRWRRPSRTIAATRS